MAKYSLKEPSDKVKYEELARISYNLRFYTKRWKEHYGAHNRLAMEEWQRKMDEWLHENVDYSPIELPNDKLKHLKGGWIDKAEVI